MPKVSVIIPAYKAENTILETIESILMQTFQDFEVLAETDDCRLVAFNSGSVAVNPGSNEIIVAGRYI